jgi:hypothetical protein
MKIDLRKVEVIFSSANTFPPKLKRPLYDLSVLYDLHTNSKKIVGLLVDNLLEGCPGRRG